MLLTGATGQLGWELQRACAGFARVTAPSRSELDLASASSIMRAFRDARPDVVLNAAAYTAVDKAESEPDLAMAINGIAPALLAQEARRAGAALVHYSTDYVFDGRKAWSWREEDAAEPLNVYGRTKLAGERAVAAAGCPHLIFRTSWVYGPRGANFFMTMRRLARERKELRVVDDQVGAPTCAHYIALATMEILKGLAIGGRVDLARLGELGGLYHMTSAGSTTWYGFAAEILRNMPDPPAIVPIQSAQFPTPARRPSNSVMDNAKLLRSFDIALPDWRDGLAWCLGRLGDADYRAA